MKSFEHCGMLPCNKLNLCNAVCVRLDSVEICKVKANAKALEWCQIKN
jgi:hypothetical protein